MIQFKRGKTSDWLGKATSIEPLAPGQPGYDTDRKKIKIGDGKSSWSELPYAGGLSSEEILDSEENAKARFNAVDLLLQGLGNLVGLDLSRDKQAVITYGTARPDENTVGKIYLQQYEEEPETDYVIEHGKNGIWQYRKWKSGRAECYGSYTIETSICEELSGVALYTNNTKLEQFSFPFSFIEAPVETVTVAGDTELVWIATSTQGNSTQTAKYRLVSYTKRAQQANYRISFTVVGLWK